jgi:hypothetical protein
MLLSNLDLVPFPKTPFSVIEMLSVRDTTYIISGNMDENLKITGHTKPINSTKYEPSGKYVPQFHAFL